MKETLTLDSSVFVAAFRKQEEKHQACRNLLSKISDGEYLAIQPYTVFVEIVAAVKRRTGSAAFVHQVEKNLKEISFIHFLEIVKRRADEAAQIAIESGLKGMDALVVQVSREVGSYLVTLDTEMETFAKHVVPVKTVDEFL